MDAQGIAPAQGTPQGAEGGSAEAGVPGLSESFAAAVAAAAVAAAAGGPALASTPQPAGVLPNYPPARAMHEEVVENRELFMTTLRETLHALGGSLDKVPRMASRELDLHQLYCNVTALGGCARVTSEKKWREAAGSFGFPETITSVSYQLRQTYQRLLWDYEQIYFWHNTGPRVPPPSNPTTPRSEPVDGQRAQGRKRKAADKDVVMTTFPALAAGTPIQLTAMSASPGAGPEAVCVGAKGTVKLDARFDAGYFVTVRVVGQEFSGVLYYPPPALTVPAAPGAAQAAGRGGARPAGPAAAAAQTPRPHQPPFNFFNAEARQKLKAAQPNLTPQEVTHKVSELWMQAMDMEKAPYEALANIDRMRFQSEVEAYNYQLATEAAAQQAAEAAHQVMTAQAAIGQAANTLFLRPVTAGVGMPNGSAAPAAAIEQPQQQSIHT